MPCKTSLTFTGLMWHRGMNISIFSADIMKCKQENRKIPFYQFYLWIICIQYIIISQIAVFLKQVFCTTTFNIWNIECFAIDTLCWVCPHTILAQFLIMIYPSTYLDSYCHAMAWEAFCITGPLWGQTNSYRRFSSHRTTNLDAHIFVSLWTAVNFYKVVNAIHGE